MSESVQPSIEEVLTYMGVKRGKSREVTHNHWVDFMLLLKQHSGEDEDRILGLGRSYVGVDERYLKQYVHACLEWGTVRENNGHLFYVGLPKGVKKKLLAEPQRKARGGAHAENPRAFEP